MNNLCRQTVFSIAFCLFIGTGVCWADDSNQANEQDQLVFNLEQAVMTGLENNPRIRAGEYGIRRSEADLKSARGQFLPQASAGAGFTHLKSIYASGPTDQDYLDQNQYHWNLRLIQTLFAGRTILNNYQKAKIQKEISELEKESAERELIREIQYYFLSLLKARQDLQSVQNTIERLKVGLEAASAFHNVRMAPYVEVLQAEVELEEARQDLIRIENEVRIQSVRLNSLLSISNNVNVQYRGDLGDLPRIAPPSLEEALDIAIEKRTDLEFIRKNIETALREKSISRGRKMPVVNLELNYFDRTRDYRHKGRDMFGQSIDRDQTNHYWTAGVTVQWNFFSGGQNYYRGQSMDYEVRRLKEIMEDAASSILSEAETAYLRVTEAKERFASTQKTIRAASENYSMQEHRFKQRVGTIQELLIAQEHLSRAETNRNQALLDYQLALSELYFALGERNYGLD